MRPGWADSFTHALPDEIKEALDVANKLFGISEYKNIFGCQINSFVFSDFIWIKTQNIFECFIFIFLYFYSSCTTFVHHFLNI